MELKDTVEMMNSGDYRERFKAEYYQLKIRVNSLQKMLNEWESGKLHFAPTCSKKTLFTQLKIMLDYMAALEDRADQEGIELQK